MKKNTTHLLLSFVAVCFYFFAQQAQAIGYAGIGGRPAYPDTENPRTESIFIHTITGGESVTDGVELLNNAETTKTLVVYAVDSTTSSDGAFACAQQSEEQVSVGSWISFVGAETEVTLEPNTNTIIPFTITVPTDADVGESNGCIVIQEKKPTVEKQAGVNLTFRTGIRVAVLVPGDIVRSLSIAGFTQAENADKTRTLHIAVENSGNVSIDTTVHSQLRGIFGETLYTQNGQFPVLRGEIGEWHFDLPNSFWGGWYHGTLEVTYDKHAEASIGVASGKGTTTLSADIGWFFMVPSKTGMIIEMITLVVVLLIVVCVCMMMRRKRIIRSTWVKYTPQSTTSITEIAETQEISWKKLAHINNLRAPYTIRAGQVILVPKVVAETPKIVDTTVVEKPSVATSHAKSKRAKKAQPKKKTHPRD
ncbi:MAG: DUF916 domain-containing protein [Candidatus Kerfeldbacteria bacterium]|nr:DUF916 domain-containing protein [Candidatus Kerfeldbacteria bacterium]